MPRPLIAVLATLILLAAPSAFAQGPSPGLGGPGLGGKPPVKNLTNKDVQRLLKVIPEVAVIGAKYSGRFMDSLGGQRGPMDPPSEKELEEMHAVLQKHHLELMEFAMQMSTLMVTYFSLNPKAFDEQIPSEDSPEVKKMLQDSNLTDEQKKDIREKLALARKNKEQMRAHLEQLTNAQNKEVVKPYLKQIEKVLADAKAQGQKSLQQNKSKGPRKKQKQ